ncbi:MAG: glutamine amidotransferase [Cytophagaceae bacterium]|mgnify:CR=1 FL=1|nr:glutamine amidotransferase [Cytophagaceae bacterium]
MKQFLYFFISLILLGCEFNTATTQNKTTTQPQVASQSLEDDLEIKRPRIQLDSARYNVGLLIMDGTYNTELTAPYDIFQHTIFRDSIKAMNVFTVANTLDPIRTFEGMYILPDFDYTDATVPNIDILVVPSAEHHLDSDLEDEQMISFVKKVAQQASYVTSHCDGAFVLAAAGLLDGKVATTFPADIDRMRQEFPKVDVRKEVLFVHDGKYITSAGGAKSFEAALYLAEKLYGKTIAASLAKGLVIDWEVENVPHLIVD